MAARRSRQIDGYPPQHADALRSAVRYAVIANSITGGIALAGTLAVLYFGIHAGVAAAAIALFLLFGVLGGLGGVYDTWRYVRIIPYFRSQVGDTDTFLAGEALAQFCSQLDAAAIAAGVLRLSAFGFNDDLFGEPLTWHRADDGLKTVTALRNALTTEKLTLPCTDSVLEDLRKLEHALSRAAEQDIPFCLLLRHGNTTSGHEWSVRQGTAF